MTIESIQFQGWEGLNLNLEFELHILNSLGILYQMGEVCLWNNISTQDS